MSNPLYKQIRISWEYPRQPTSLQVGNIRIVRSTEPFVVETALAQTQIDYREYDSSFTSFVDTFELEYDVTYYYMIIVYGDIDSTILAATSLYSISIESPKEIPTPLPNEIYFTTMAGTIDYLGSVGDQIIFSNGETITISGGYYLGDIAVPLGRHKIVLTDVRERNYVGLGGGALLELHNFPTLSSVSKFDFCPGNNSINLVAVPTVLPPNITEPYYMFSGAEIFNQDISMWDTSNVLNMEGMFSGATSFNQDISSWNVSKVTNMNYMFSGATLFNSDISNWDVSSVTDMQDMFNGATSFNQDLSQWCVTNIASLPLRFNEGATNWTLPRPVWGTCPRR